MVALKNQVDRQGQPYYMTNRLAKPLQATLAVDGRPFTFPTGRGGEYYVEDLKPGRYTARLAANGQSCTFELVVPRSSEPFTELREIVCDSGR